MYTNIRRGLLWLVAPLAFGLVSCNDDGTTIGASFGSESDFDIGYIDSVGIKVSTVLLDSLPSSGNGHLMVGKYTDAKLGAVESQLFMEISNGSGWGSPSDDAIFDSLVLILPYSQYAYGDTTTTLDLHVYQARDEFTTYPLPLFWQYEGRRPYFTAASGYFFNTSSVDYYSMELGARSFKPRPHGQDSILIHLSDNLGKSWFEEAKNTSNFFSSLSLFLDQFQGITVKAESGNAIVGIAGASVKMRVYYRDLIAENMIQKTYDLPYVSADYAFNRVTTDRQGTMLEELGPDKKVISSTATNDEAYVQSGLGLLTKIEFPHIEDLLDIPGMLIVNSATLTIEPVKGTFPATTPLPSTLVMFQTDKSNQPMAPLLIDYSSTEQSAGIAFDEEFGINSGYTFSITQYVQMLLNNPEARANGTALLLSTPLEDFLTTVNRVCVGDNQHADYRMRLNIYYTYRK
jgi:hypothetical protein